MEWKNESRWNIFRKKCCIESKNKRSRMEIYHEKSHKRNNNVSENQKFYILKVETIELFIAETCIESYWIRWHLRIFIVFKELTLYILEHLINQFTTIQFLFRWKLGSMCVSAAKRKSVKKSFWNNSRSQFHFTI